MYKDATGQLSNPKEPAKTPEETYKLDDLVKRITNDNIHEELDFGRPEGKEVW